MLQSQVSGILLFDILMTFQYLLQISIFEVFYVYSCDIYDLNGEVIREINKIMIKKDLLCRKPLFNFKIYDFGLQQASQTANFTSRSLQLLIFVFKLQSNFVSFCPRIGDEEFENQHHSWK